MAWITGTMVVLVIIIVAIFVSVAAFKAANQANEARAIGWGARAVAVIALAAWLIGTLSAMAHSVDAGEVGIVRTFGNITGQRESGLQFTLPWQSLDTIDTKTQKFSNSGTSAPAYVSFSKETQDVLVRASLVYRVDRTNVQTLIRESGFAYFSTLGVENLLVTILKEETVKYTAVDIAPNREPIRNAIAARLSETLAKHSLVVEQFTLDNIDFDEQFKQAIANKAAATQNAQAEQNKVAVSQAQAQQAIEAAKGAAGAAIESAKGAAQARTIAAEAEAGANKTINASLTPELLQYKAITTLAPNIQIALVPSGAGLLIDPTTLLAPKK